MERWIKLYEKIKEWQHYQEPTVLLVFIDILLSANTKDGWSLGRMIKRGELVTSVAQIMFSTGIKSDNTVRAALRKLEASVEIKRERFGNGSKITIIQFDKYQGLESPKRQEPRQPEDIEEPEELPQESENTETEAMWDAVIKPWLEYKKEKKQSYKGERSLKALKTKLKRLSGDNLEVARQIIEQSMANNYSGLFELKDQNTQKQSPQPQNANDNAFNDFYFSTYGTNFVWQADTSSEIQKLAETISDKITEAGHIVVPSDIPGYIRSFLAKAHSLGDQWLNQHFTPKNINKQFNEIYAYIKSGKKPSNGGKRNNPTGVSDEYLLKLQRDLVGGVQP